MKNVYKTLVLLIIISAHQLITTSSFAQAPQKMSYQAVIRNTLDQLVKESPVGMKISILQGTETGAVAYAETQTPSTNENGLVKIEIGGGTPVTGTFSGINWASGPFFIKTEADPSGGTTYTITGTSQLLSVPYALYAKSSGNINNGTTVGDMLYWNGTSWVRLAHGTTGQVLSVNSSNIPYWGNAASISLLPPVAITSAATEVHDFYVTLNGTINPNGLATEVEFEYGLTTAYGETDGEWDYFYGTSDITLSMRLPFEFDEFTQFLEPSTTYHYRLVASNPVNVTYGNDMTFTTAATAVTVGQNYQGGKVAYILHPNDSGYIPGETHGLVVSTSDLSTGVQWYNGTNIEIGAWGQAIGTGESNTDMIVTAQGSGTYAARICYIYTSGGYTNWYLPSIDELHKILSNKTIIGGFGSGYYWSSTESGAENAVAADVSYGSAYLLKSETYSVRAVHSF